MTLDGINYARRSIEMENLKGVDSIGDNNTDVDDKLPTTSHCAEN